MSYLRRSATLILTAAVGCHPAATPGQQDDAATSVDPAEATTSVDPAETATSVDPAETATSVDPGETDTDVVAEVLEPCETGDFGASTVRWAAADSTAAAFDPSRCLAFVGRGDTIVSVDLHTGTAVTTTSAPDPIVDLSVAGDTLYALTGAAAITRYDIGAQLTPHGSIEVPDAGVFILGLTPDRFAVGISPNQQTYDVAFVDMATEAVATADVNAFVYNYPQLAADDDYLYAPTAYPGEVKRIDIASLSVDVFPLVNWLHSVQLLDDGRVIASGHLDGVAAFALGVDEPVEEDDSYMGVSPLASAYTFVGAEHVYVVEGATAECHDTSLALSHTVAVPFEEDPNKNRSTTLPLGERTPGQLIVHQPRIGLVEIDCNAP